MVDKAALRARFRALRAAVSAAERSGAGQRVAERLLAYEPFTGARTVAAFAAFRDEIPTEPLIAGLLARGTRVLLPRVLDGAGRMQVCEFSKLSALSLDRFGIPTPDGPAFDGPLDLVFVPGLAVDLAGDRLGFGGGYYDRFLVTPQCRQAWRCGVVYDAQLVDALPVEAHDVRLTHIGTPTRVVACHAG